MESRVPQVPLDTVKLCRFELKAEPERIRSGMVFSGKIYETDGAQAIAVHEAADVRPLAPIRLAPSLRIFRGDLQAVDLESPRFFYGNPVALGGPSIVINIPDATVDLGFVPYVAAVLVTDAYQIEVNEADDAILGLTLITLLVGRDIERAERICGVLGASQDIGGAIGPVLTTPDELDDNVLDEKAGRRYQLEAVTRVNGIEIGRGNLADLRYTFAEAISAASQTCTLKEGDIFAMGPAAIEAETLKALSAGDDIQFAVEKLGTLSIKLSQDQ